MPAILTPGTFAIVNASSALQQVQVLNTLGANLVNSSAMNASSAIAYAGLLAGAAQVITTLVAQGQEGLQVSS